MFDEHYIERNGTNQIERMLDALHPEFAKLDERTTSDLLHFARDFAEELYFYNESNSREGTWGEFIGDDSFIENAIAYLNGTDKFTADENGMHKLTRPHFVLFMVFLHLIRTFPQKSLNRFTKRHLDYYYRQILNFEPRSTTPDLLHVIVGLAKNYKQNKFLLDKGTKLDGGKDKKGNKLVYSTQADLFVSRAEVAQLCTVFTQNKRKYVSNYSFNSEFIPMLRLVLGENSAGELEPGGQLPEITFWGDDNDISDSFFKTNIPEFLQFTKSELGISLADFRRLMQLKHNRDFDLNEWLEIEAEMRLMRPGLNDSTFQGARKFIDNFIQATAIDPLDSENFSTIPNVNTIYELYDELLNNSDNDDIQNFIHVSFYGGNGNLNENIEGFTHMMAVREKIREEWLQIIEILQNSSHSLPANFDREDFLENTDWAVFSIDSVFSNAHNSVLGADDYYTAFIEIERYFGLYGEEIISLMQGNDVETLLNKAHKNKHKVKRADKLRAVKLAGSSSGYFMDVMREALGHPSPGNDLPALPAGIVSLKVLYNHIQEESSIDYINNSLYLSVDDFSYIMNTQKDEGALPDSKAPEWKWERVYNILIEAERVKRSIQEPPNPSKSYFKGIKATNDARSVVANVSDEKYPSWKTFGNASMPNAQLGMLVSSSYLFLESGKRTIHLKINIKPYFLVSEENIAELNNSLAKNIFSVYLSTQKGWLNVDADASIPPSTSTDEWRYIMFEIVLDEQIEAIAPLPIDHSDAYKNIPAIKVILDDSTAYPLFKNIEFENVTLETKANGMQPIYRNDTTVAKPGEPFEIFGNHPHVGSQFSFTHKELASKKLKNIDLILEWQDEDYTNFQNIYMNYDIENKNEKWTESTHYKANIRMYDRGIVRKYASDDHQVSLFENSGRALNLSEDQQYSTYSSLNNPLIEDSILESDRYFFLELDPLDFGHDRYPQIAAQKANELAIDIASNSQKESGFYQVNPPYTPVLKNFIVNYNTETDSNVEVFHVHPFGKNNLLTEKYFLPQYHNEGELYIGIENLEPPTELSMLFQMAEGSASPDVQAPKVAWEYLANNNWKRLDNKGNILSDTTNGLLNTGIVTVKIPEDASSQHTIMPNNVHWIKAIANENSIGLSDTVNIHTQAVVAILEKEGVDEEHFNSPLPPESIKNLVRRKPEIKGVWQPYSSYGGNPTEDQNNLYKRVSERLRHKNRALTSWDYERLILEKFPKVFQAKCIAGSSYGDTSPGDVTIIVVPNIKGIRPFDPFEPKLPQNTLHEIKRFLQAKASPNANIEVRNPVYLKLQVRMSVELYAQYESDTNYYLNKLYEGLLRLLAPWAYDEGTDITIGGRFYPGVIINFVEEQPYVDYIKDFKIYVIEDGKRKLSDENQMKEGIVMERADGIWVSSKDHVLDTTGTTGKGIGYMKVEIDLIVG